MFMNMVRFSQNILELYANDVEDGGCAKCKQSRGLGSEGPKIPISFNDAQNLQHSSELHNL
jgi:hypothetical protein